MNSYLVINGNKTELTKEQLQQLGIVEKSPFDRAGVNEKYYCIERNGSVAAYEEDDDIFDKEDYEVANYCTDKSLMKQRALHEILNRLLWRFACENGELENKWGFRYRHYFITYDPEIKEFEVGNQYYKSTETTFPSYELAERAIEEIVKPFMEEHPDFEW